MRSYLLFILCKKFMLPACTPNFAQVALTTEKVHHTRCKQCLPLYCPNTQNLTENI
jgi:hypothetical protein